MKNCIFCDIINKQKSGYVIYEDGKTLVLLDIFPSVEGHVLVIPKRHGVTILDFSDSELEEVFVTVKKLVKALEKTYKTLTFTIGINHNEPKGVPHLHVHILPRNESDNGGIIQTIVKQEVKKSLEEVRDKIKKNI